MALDYLNMGIFRSKPAGGRGYVRILLCLLSCVGKGFAVHRFRGSEESYRICRPKDPEITCIETWANSVREVEGKGARGPYPLSRHCSGKHV
jgi:hypothetical protein